MTSWVDTVEDGFTSLTKVYCQLFMTDADASFSKKIGWTRGERTNRYAMIIDHGKVTYAENEPGGDVTVSDRSSKSTLTEFMLTRSDRCLAPKPCSPTCR